MPSLIPWIVYIRFCFLTWFLLMELLSIRFFRLELLKFTSITSNHRCNLHMPLFQPFSSILTPPVEAVVVVVATTFGRIRKSSSEGKISTSHMPRTILRTRMPIVSQLCNNFVYSHASIYSPKDNQSTVARAYRLSR